MKKTFQHSLLLFLVSAQLGTAVPNTWTGTTDTNMGTSTNWSAGAPTLAGNSDLSFPPTGVTNFSVVDNIVGTLTLTSLTFNSTTPYTMTASSGCNFSFTVPGAITSTGTNSINVPIALSNSMTITSSNGVLSILGAFSGTGTSMTIASGSVLFNVGNAYAGPTIISSGATLQVTTAAALSNTVTNTVTLDGTLNFALTGTETFTPVISRTVAVTGGGLKMTGSGTLTLSGNNNTAPTPYTGPVAITAGILAISNNNNIGDNSSTNVLSLGPGTLRITTAGTLARTISLTGAGTIDTSTPAVAVELSSVISEATTGAGSLIITAGSSSLTLSGVNTYTGGTTIQSGTLNISQQSNIGTGNLIIGTSSPTLKITQPIASFSTPIILAGPGTINISDISAGDVKLVKPITGSGLLTIVAGSSTLTLSSVGGASTYGGGTYITSGTVIGDTSSIIGAYSLSTTSTNLTFDQTISGTLIPSGTYAGVLTSATSGDGRLNKVNDGTVILSGLSGSTFTGPTTVSGGTLNITGALGGTITVNSGATLSGATTSVTGSGTVNTVSIGAGGFIGPNGLKTLNITSTLDLTNTSTYSVEIAPAGVSDLLNITGAATLNSAKILVDPDTGFYGFGSSYTILQAGSITGDFATPTSTDSNFIFTTTKEGAKVYLNLVVIEPFLDFPASNANTQSVVNYFNALGAAGLLTSNSTLVGIINSLAGQSFAVINDALDQLHPAAFSAFEEVQADVGGHLISLFHRRPGTTSCPSSWRLWIEPYGNWLEEKHTGMQEGFLAQSYGSAIGIDGEIFQNFVIGIGGAYNHTNLAWKRNRGHADTNGYYGAAYFDYTYNSLYFGGALLAGLDHYHTDRHIQFTTIDMTATGSHSAFDLIAQFSTGMFFGPSACCVAPYLNVDYFLLQQEAFTETGAPGLNLSIHSANSQTIRTELGVGLQVKDTNYAQTMSLSPRVAIGWTMEAPIHRENYTSSLQGETLTFDVKGWDYTWQLFSFKLGLDFSYNCFTVGGEYIGEISGNDKFWGQQANANFSWHW